MADKRVSKQRKVRDWTGTRQGNVTIIGRGPRVHTASDRHSRWVGQCDCGKRRLIRSADLIKGVVKTCGDQHCPYRQVYGKRKGVQDSTTQMTQQELREALLQPCALCGTQEKENAVLGLRKPKLGYVLNNTIVLCGVCRGLQPGNVTKKDVPSFQKIMYHICKMLNHLMDTGDIKMAPESEAQSSGSGEP